MAEINQEIVLRWKSMFKVGDLTKIESFARKNYPAYQKWHQKIPNAIKNGFGDDETTKIINEYYKIK